MEELRTERFIDDGFGMSGTMTSTCTGTGVVMDCKWNSYGYFMTSDGERISLWDGTPKPFYYDR